MAILGVFTGWINFIACLIFSLYIGYDWVKAGDNYKSTTTAVLAAADLYLDIINLSDYESDKRKKYAYLDYIAGLFALVAIFIVFYIAITDKDIDAEISL